MSFLHGSRDGPYWASEGKKEKQRLDTWRKTGCGCTGPFVGELSVPRSKRVYYIRLSRETGLFYMNIQGGQVYGVELDQGNRLS